jgi:hypothetical protein
MEMRKIGDYDAWVLGNFVGDAGRLFAIPAQRKKRMAVLRSLRTSSLAAAMRKPRSTRSSVATMSTSQHDPPNWPAQQ